MPGMDISSIKHPLISPTTPSPLPLLLLLGKLILQFLIDLYNLALPTRSVHQNHILSMHVLRVDRILFPAMSLGKAEGV